MKILAIIITLLAGILLWSEIIYVPEDFEAIRVAMFFAEDGDLVLVSPGTYYDNINFDGKAITVASLFYTTQDTSYISQTIIDGGMEERVVVFWSEEDENSVLTGFTITHGFTHTSGAGVYAAHNCSPTLNNLRIVDNLAESRGGGFFFGESSNPVISNLLIESNSADYGGGGAYHYYCDLIMENSIIRNNVSEHCGGGLYSQAANAQFENVIVENNCSAEGGGFYFDYFSDSASFRNVTIQNNEAIDGAGIYCQADLYLENVLITGNIAENRCGGLLNSGGILTFAEETSQRCSIYLNEAGEGIGQDIYSFGDPLEIFLAEFTVMEPNIFYAFPINQYTFDIQSGIVAQIDADLYVSPSGNDGNSGLSAAEPLRTIRHASEIILPKSIDPHTIHLAEGAYYTFTSGESFPVYVTQDVNIQGENRETVVLVGDGNSSVMSCEYVNNVTISGLTLTNGGGDNGAGFFCQESNVTLENIMVLGNNSSDTGGGLHFISSTATLKNMIIANNSTIYAGSGIMSEYSDLQIINVTSTGNLSDNAGAAIYLIDSGISVINSIFWNNSPAEISCSIFTENTLEVAYSNIAGGENAIDDSWVEVQWLWGNIDDDPKFVDAAHGGFHLMDDSPCIDAGTAYFEYEGEVLVDLQEDEYWGAAPDMGACEYLANDIDDHVIEIGKLKMENYPNPFNPETTISFNLPEEGEVKLGIYNLKGQLVEKLLAEKMTAGEHSLTWSGQRAGSGIYLVRLQAGNLQEMRKIVMVK